MTLRPPSDHELLVFWVSLLIIVVAARALGSLMRRIGQPSVVGELAAGLVLGPSILGRVAPGVSSWLFPDDDVQTGMLFTVGWLGVMFLLVATGFETDLGLIRRLGKAATYVSTGSLVVPMAAGFGVGWLIPGSFLGGGTQRLVFALFIAAALSISSLPVISKILSDMGLMRRDFGQLTLAAGMANDVIGWIALGVIAGMAEAGDIKLGKLALTMVGLAAFFAAAFTIGQRGVDHMLRRVRSAGNDPVQGLAVIVGTALTFGVVTQLLHVEAVLGAFVAGVIIARSRFADHHLMQPLEAMTNAVFAPVFFATAGLRVDLGLLGDPTTLLWALLVLVAASLSKLIGSLAGAKLARLSDREGMALGVGLNARGALEIVIATVGLRLDVLNSRSFTVIVLMAMATSMAAPPLLRLVLRNFDGSPSERRRLDQEHQLAANTLVGGGRILLPTRGGVASLLAAQVAGLVWPKGSVSLLTIGSEGRPGAGPVQDVLGSLEVLDISSMSASAVDAIIDEAALGYEAIVIGCSGESGDGLFSPLVDAVLSASPVPVLVVRMPRLGDGTLPWAFGSALVPVSARDSSLAGQEVAAYLSSAIGTQLHHLYVSTGATPALVPILGDYGVRTSSTRQVLDAAATLATRVGANFASIFVHAESPARQILATANELAVDLVVVSGMVRHTGDHLFPGQTIERIVHETNTALIVALTPERTT